MNDNDLRGLLSRAATEHRPDRTAMLNRIAQQRAGLPGRRPRGQLVRIAGAALAVSAVIGAGGVARWALAEHVGPDPSPAAPPVVAASPGPVTAAPPVPTGSPTTAGVPGTTRPTSVRPRSTPPSKNPRTGGNTAEQGPLWSDGSVVTDGDRAARSEITLKLAEPLTALTVTVRVKLTPGLSDQGAVHDVTGTRIDSTILHEPDALTYRFDLAAGETLVKGTHVFAAKYLYGSGGRDAGADSYRAVATTVGGKKLAVSGYFS